MALYAFLQSWTLLRLGRGGVVNYCSWRMVRLPQVAAAFCKAYKPSGLFPEVEALHSVWLSALIEDNLIAGCTFAHHSAYNKSLHASGGSVFLINPGAAKVA